VDQKYELCRIFLVLKQFPNNCPHDIVFFLGSNHILSMLFLAFTRAVKDVTAKPGRVPTSRDAFERDISFLT
jgi:hypothetical protein